MTFNGKEVTARTLTVAEVKKVLDGLRESGEVDIVDMLLDDVIPASAISMATGIGRNEMTSGDVTPEDLRGLVDEVREKNPTFAAMMDRLVMVGKKITSAGK